LCYIYSDLELQGQTNISPNQTDSISSLIKADGLKGKAKLAVAFPAPSSSMGGVNNTQTCKHQHRIPSAAQDDGSVGLELQVSVCTQSLFSF